MSVIKFIMKNAVSHPSVSAKVFAARVDLVTRLNLVIPILAGICKTMNTFS